MAEDLYFAKDGTIHKNPISVANNKLTTNTRVTNNLDEYSRIINRTYYQVSEGRIVFFWALSMIFAVLIGLESYKLFGSQIFGNGDDIFSLIGPYVMVIGSVIGSFIYCRDYASKLYYNLWAYFVSILFSLFGMIATIIAIFLISFTIMIALTILGILAGIGILCAISENS